MSCTLFIASKNSSNLIRKYKDMNSVKWQKYDAYFDFLGIFDMYCSHLQGDNVYVLDSLLYSCHVIRLYFQSRKTFKWQHNSSKIAWSLDWPWTLVGVLTIRLIRWATSADPPTIETIFACFSSSELKELFQDIVLNWYNLAEVGININLGSPLE